MRVRHLHIPFTLGLGCVLALLWLLSNASTSPLVASAASYTVCPAGPPTCGYSTVQAAVDAAGDGDVIKVATSTYTGVSARAGVTQVVYISKSLTIRGGYTTAFTEPPNPKANPTTLDALGSGRVVYLTGGGNVVLENLRVTGGYATDNGGGIYNDNVLLTLSNASLSSNSAMWNGGGVYIWNGSVTLEGGRIISNSAGVCGGGVYIHFSAFTQTVASTIAHNTAGDSGGGVCAYFGNATMSGGQILGNSAAWCGGVYVGWASVALSGNQIISNSAMESGGGVCTWGGILTLEGGQIISNSARGNGGGVFVEEGNATLINSVVADNRADDSGSGLYIGGAGGSSRLLHTTITRNSGGNGSGINVSGYWEGCCSIALTNTILVSHMVGITVTAGNTATLNGVLWYSNAVNYGGEGTITVTNEYTGDPAFAADGYHLTAFSEAIDKGVNAGVGDDLDGDPRPINLWSDLGADEYSTGCFARLNDGVIYPTVQAAVDASTQLTDVVKLAGYCTGVNARASVTQVVYISKTLTVRGGYTTTDWSTSYSISYPTTLDAQGQGRVFYVTGDISPTIEGLHITGGDAAGLSGGFGVDPRVETDVGGGVFIKLANANLNGNWVFSNTAMVGGGLYLVDSDATIINNSIFSNTVYYDGGGILVYSGETTIQENAIFSNTAGDVGGGLTALHYDRSKITGNTIFSNTANEGGGLALWDSECKVNSNIIFSNSSFDGGGLFLIGNAPAIYSNRIFSNRSNNDGGGLYIELSNPALTGNNIFSNNADRGGGMSLYKSNAVLMNNIVTGNLVNGPGIGSGIAVLESSLCLLHTTIARNHGGDGSGINSFDSSMALTNTVIAAQQVGIAIYGGAVKLAGTLWGSGSWANFLDWDAQGAIFESTVDVWDDPTFVNPDAGDYHIGPNSAAMDAGVNARVTSDIDGDPRPMGHGYDIGADELRIALAVSKQATPNPVAAGAQLTYTLRVTNTGDITLTATVTDVLPDHVTTPQAPVWTETIPAPGGIWTEMLVVTAEVGYAGPLTNVVQVATVEGATGAYTEISTVQPGGSPPPKYLIYLPLVIRNY